MSGSYFQPIKREFLNLSGGTVSGNTVFTQGLYANSLSGGTLFSGSTNLEDIFLTSSQISGTTLSEGPNIDLNQAGIDYKVSVVDSPSFNNISYSGTSIGGNSIATNVSATTGFYSAGTNLEDIFLTSGDISGTSVSAGSNVDVQQSGIDYNVSIVSSPSFNNISYSGTSIGGNSIATNVSATTGFYSAGTSLETIIYNIANSTEDITNVQPGSNITTGGTVAVPIVSLVASPSINSLAFSGSAIGNAVSANTISASTIYSGSTNLYSIFSTHDYYTTGATFNAPTKVATFNRNDGASYTLNLSALTTVDTYVTAVTFSSTTLVLDQNEGQPRLTAPIPTTSLSGVLSSATFNIYTTGAMSASTFYGNGSGLTGIDDYYTTGATFDAPTKVATFNRNDGASYTLNLSALTTVDTYTTGFTYNPATNVLTIKQNESQPDLTATINSFSSVTITGLTVNSSTQFNGDINVDGNVLITKNVTILGTATTINTETITVKDNIVTLNSSATGSTAPLPINSGIEILRNSGTTAALVWEETNGYWAAGLTGSTARIILQGDGLNLLNSGHTHPISEIIGLQSALDTKFDKSGGTITGGVYVNNSFSANSIYSGSTNLYDIFLTSSSNDITRVQPGSNITTGGTDNYPIVNLVASPSINNLSFSGTAIGPSLSATTMSGSTLRLSSSAFVGSTSSIQWGDNGMAGTINGFLSMSSNGVFRFGDSLGGGSPIIIMGSAGAATGISLKRNGTGLQVRNGDDTAYASLSAASIVGTSVSATTISATTYFSGTTPLSSVFVNNVNAGSNTSIGGSSTQPIINVVASPSFNNLTLSGSANFNTLIVNSTSQLNGAISSGNLSGTTDRMVQVSSGGTLSASKQIISAYIVSGGTVANILENESNWDINGDFIGSGITGTYMGQKHYNYNYFFEAIEDNQWIRLIRG